MNNPEDDIQRKIAALMARTTVRTPATRKVLEHLAQIEEAIAQGVPRADLAAVYGLDVDRFAAALAGARRLHRQGGDGRRTEVRQARRKGATTGVTQGPAPLDGSFLKRL